VEPVGGLAERPERGEARRLLFGRHRLEDHREVLLPRRVGFLDSRPARRRRADEDDAPIVLVADALHEPPFLHPSHDAGEVRQRHIELLREPAHRDPWLRLEQHQHVQRGVTDRTKAPVACHRLALARHHGRKLGEDRGDGRGRFGHAG
jgi:hypothetical protein